MSRIDDALHYLAEQASASRHEFCRDNHPDGAHLLSAVSNLGYVIRKGDRVALSPAGLRRVQATEGTTPAVDAA